MYGEIDVNKQDATYENKLFRDPFWNQSQFSSSCNSTKNTIGDASKDPQERALKVIEIIHLLW